MGLRMVRELLPYVPPSMSMAPECSSQGRHHLQPWRTPRHPGPGGTVWVKRRPSSQGKASGIKAGPRERTWMAKLGLSHAVWGWLSPGCDFTSASLSKASFLVYHGCPTELPARGLLTVPLLCFPEPLRRAATWGSAIEHADWAGKPITQKGRFSSSRAGRDSPPRGWLAPSPEKSEMLPPPSVPE